jgi:hypothetical protein
MLQSASRHPGQRRICRMKTIAPALAAATVLILAGCGGSEAQAPLGLDQRIPSVQDVPGSQADPSETRVRATGQDELIARLGDRFVNPTQKDITELRSSGFVQAINDTRFVPAEAGGPPTPFAERIFSLVMQFDSEDGAQKALDFLHTDSLRPCPESCATQVSEFDVGDIPDSHGTRRYATAESIKATGADGPPFDSYEIEFADGPFAYRIILKGPPANVSENEAEDIAGRLYDRVAGAPAKT